MRALVALGMLVLVAVACAGSPNAQPAVSTTVIATSSVAETTAVPSTTTTGPRGLLDAELLACMAGSWRLDTEGFEAKLQAKLDPGRDSIIVDYVSGGGSLEVGTDSSFTLGYDDLTYRVAFPTGGRTIEDLVVVSGEVSGVFTLEGDVFAPGEVADPVLVIRRVVDGEETGELPPMSGFGGSLRMGTRANHPYDLKEINIDCNDFQLVVNHLQPVQPLSENDPPVIWSREGGGR